MLEVQPQPQEPFPVGPAAWAGEESWQEGLAQLPVFPRAERERRLHRLLEGAAVAAQREGLPGVDHRPCQGRSAAVQAEPWGCRRAWAVRLVPWLAAARLRASLLRSGRAWPP